MSHRREIAKEFRRIIGDRQPIADDEMWAIAESALGARWDVEIAREAFDDLIDDGEIEQDVAGNLWLT